MGRGGCCRRKSGRSIPVARLRQCEVTPAGEDAYQPRWSPDGDQLAYLAVSCAGGQPCDRKAGPISLFVTKPDGSGRQTLAENLDLAEKLGLNGTPSYVIGSNVVIGAVGLDKLKENINTARCGKTTTC